MLLWRLVNIPVVVIFELESFPLEHVLVVKLGGGAEKSNVVVAILVDSFVITVCGSEAELSQVSVILYYVIKNTTYGKVYSAVIMARPLQEFTQFMWWMQTKRQEATNPQTKPTDLVCESACILPPSTPTVTIYYYCSARRLVLILPSHRG